MKCSIIIKRNVSLTVVVESVKMNEVGSVPEVDISLTVCPALYYDATRLMVEWKQRAVQLTRSLHHSTKPPSHSTIVMNMHPEPVEIFLRVKIRRAVADSNNDFLIFFKLENVPSA